MQRAAQPQPTAGTLDVKFAALLLVCVAAAVLLWWSPLLLPFRLFVTMVHELSHALAAIITGGAVLGIAIQLDGSGVTLVRGGSLFLVASAGYVGSSLFGAGLLLLARLRARRRLLLQALAIGLLLATLFFFRNLVGIGAALLLASAFWALAARGPDWAVALFVYWLAVLNGLYAVFDLLVLMELSGPAAAAASDAATLQRATAIPALVWAVLWTAAAVGVQFLALRATLRGPAAPRLQAGRSHPSLSPTSRGSGSS
jgi:hypothetical protein